MDEITADAGTAAVLEAEAESIPESGSRTRLILLAALGGLAVVAGGALALRGRGEVPTPKVVPAEPPQRSVIVTTRRPPLEVAEGALEAADLATARDSLERAWREAGADASQRDRIRHGLVRLAGRQALAELAGLPSLADYPGRDALERGIAAMEQGEDERALSELYEFLLSVPEDRPDHQGLAQRAVARLRVARLVPLVTDGNGADLEPQLTYGEQP